MANRTYLINHSEKAPVSLDNQHGNWLLTANYQIPILWLAMFSDTDLTTVETRVENDDGWEGIEPLPTLVATTKAAVRRYESRRDLLHVKIPQIHLQHMGEWEAFVASQLSLPFLQLEFSELRMMGPEEFDTSLRNWLSAFSSESHPGWEELCLQACLEQPEVARYGIRGYPWNADFKWE